MEDFSRYLLDRAQLNCSTLFFWLKVIHHSTRLERKLLENSLSTNKLEKQLIIQTNDISKLNDKNSFLEKKVDEMEEQRQVEQKMLRDEKEQLQALILRQTAIIGELELQLLKVSSNNTGLQRQQQELLDAVNNLIHSISVSSARGESALQLIINSFMHPQVLSGYFNTQHTWELRRQPVCCRH